MAGTIACDRCGNVLRRWDKGLIELRFRTKMHCEPCSSLLAQVEEEVRVFSQGVAERSAAETAAFREQVEARIMESGQ